MSLLAELQRRKVFKVGATYLVAARVFDAAPDGVQFDNSEIRKGLIAIAGGTQAKGKP